MPVEIKNVELFSVDGQEGKSGYYGNVLLLHRDSKSKLELFLRDEETTNELKKLEGKIVNVTVLIEQNKFGTRVGDIVSIEEFKKVA